MRSGKILQLVEERLGEYAATVLSAILSLGHAQISYLETLPELRPQSRRKKIKKEVANGINGAHREEGYADGNLDMHEDHEQPEINGVDDAKAVNGDYENPIPSQLHPTLRSLAAYGFIQRVREAHFQSPTDLCDDAEKVLRSRSDIRELKGKRLQEAIDESMDSIIRERTDGTIFKEYIPNGPPRGTKRRGGSLCNDAPRKKAKFEDIAGYEDEEDEEDGFLDNDYVGEQAPMDVRVPMLTITSIMMANQL